MKPENYLEAAAQHGRIVTLYRYELAVLRGKGRGLIVNSKAKIAVMLEACAPEVMTAVKAGSVIEYEIVDGECRIVDAPTSVRVLDIAHA